VLREVAESPNSFSPLGPGDELIETDRFVLRMDAMPSANTVQRQRLHADDVDAAIAEVRGLLRERGRVRTQWEIGSAATPAGLVELLLARGLVFDDDPHAIAVALTVPPPPAPDAAVARPVETFEELREATAVQAEAFGATADQIAEREAALEEGWGTSPNVMHGVWLDGELVCAGSCAPTEHGLLLYGGATLPSARGRGAYRALIACRWELAVARGTPTLLTQAGEMSYPILTRLGFEAVGHVDILVDEFGPADQEPSAS
jgi:hypothetical protein